MKKILFFFLLFLFNGIHDCSAMEDKQKKVLIREELAKLSKEKLVKHPYEELKCASPETLENISLGKLARFYGAHTSEYELILALCAKKRLKANTQLLRKALAQVGNCYSINDYFCTPFCGSHSITPLLGAVCLGAKSHIFVEQCIALGADVNLVDKESGESPLMLAIGYGSLEAVKMLLNNGAQLNCVDAYGMFTPLRVAVFTNNIPCALLLIEKGANIYCKNQNNEGILTCAIENGHVEMVRYLLNDVHVEPSKAEILSGRYHSLLEMRRLFPLY